MGYYQNLQAELEEIQDEELREIVAWDHAHRHLLSAEERYNILTDEVLLKRALVLWVNSETPAPKPAADHVALQTRRERQIKSWPSLQWILGWSLIDTALIVAILILVVNL
jgi:hypothetical protein